ncbi:MAG: isocitrate lyase/phosphoenolpyruvate mutase family protein [Acidiferrobacterales bacterium]
MAASHIEKAERFRALHLVEGTFLMPNAWDAGSARMLAAGPFSALGTTSAGIAFSMGVPDGQGRVSRDAMIERIHAIAGATDLPVSADLEAGYGETPEAVAATVRASIQAGAIGGNIEDDTGDPGLLLYEPDLAAVRIHAAREAANATGVPYVLTGRTDCYLVSHPNAFAEAVARANLYREAGADCLFVPGVRDADTIAALVREIAGPLNVVMGLTGSALSVKELQALGVRRISIGGSLARATFDLIRRAVREMAEEGTFAFADQQIANGELCAFFASCGTIDRNERR